jgi:hypothetical protein
MSTRKSPLAMHFVPNFGPWSDGMTSSWDSPRVGTNIHNFSDLPGEAAKQPTRWKLCSISHSSFTFSFHVQNLLNCRKNLMSRCCP